MPRNKNQGKGDCGKDKRPKKVVEESSSSEEEDGDCQYCKTTITSITYKAIQCGACDNWYCFSCTNISSKTYL